jgi:hypothetical protein
MTPLSDERGHPGFGCRQPVAVAGLHGTSTIAVRNARTSRPTCKASDTPFRQRHDGVGNMAAGERATGDDLDCLWHYGFVQGTRKRGGGRHCFLQCSSLCPVWAERDGHGGQPVADGDLAIELQRLLETGDLPSPHAAGVNRRSPSVRVTRFAIPALGLGMPRVGPGNSWPQPPLRPS